VRSEMSAAEAKNKEIMLKIYKPHINKNRWEEFEREIESVVAESGPVTAIAEERYKKNGEIKKIIFRFGNGRRTYILEPWRELACAGDWQKEHPAEYERITGLLDEARGRRAVVTEAEDTPKRKARPEKAIVAVAAAAVGKAAVKKKIAALACK
jgi:hypothetical protein